MLSANNIFNSFNKVSIKRALFICLAISFSIAILITLTNIDAAFLTSLFLSSTIVCISILLFMLFLPKLSLNFGVFGGLVYFSPICTFIVALVISPILLDHLPFILIYLMMLCVFSSSAILLFFLNKYAQKIISEKEHKALLNKAKIQTRFAEMQALQAQINPHFLFNTLASIQALISTEPELAEQLLNDYASLLKSNMQIRTLTLWPVERELSLITQYAAIYKLRFPEVSLTINVQDSANSALLPPLLIQPLVENAFQHGLVPKGNKGKINVVIGQEYGQLLIEVIDNGVGLALNQNTSGNRLALSNITERLQTLYKTKGQLYIFNNADSAGVTSRIELPLQFESS